MKKDLCQKWGSNPRPHERTRMLALLQGKIALESGALDRSAILTACPN